MPAQMREEDFADAPPSARSDELIPRTTPDDRRHSSVDRQSGGASRARAWLTGSDELAFSCHAANLPLETVRALARFSLNDRS
jgi:hypothetical protein